MIKSRIAVIAAAFILAVSTIAPAAAQKKIATYGVAFYNLENLFDTINNNGKYDKEFSPAGDRKWDSRKYWSKINRLGYAISQLTTKTTPMGPAVIGVSEIENRSVLEDLVKAKDIKDWGLKIVHHDSPDVRGVDVGLLYNPRFFRVLEVTNHTVDLPFKTRDQMCVVGLLGTKETGYSRVAVIVNHWPSRRGGSVESSPNREKAAELTRKISEDLMKRFPDIGIVVMGDLNDDPDNKSVAEVLGAVKNIEDTPSRGFFNPFWQKLSEGYGSYIYGGGWDLFDQIIVNSNLVDGKCGVKFYEAVVHNKEFLLQKEGQYKGYPLRTFGSGAWTDGYSDHLPTEIFLVRDIK